MSGDAVKRLFVNAKRKACTTRRIGSCLFLCAWFVLWIHPLIHADGPDIHDTCVVCLAVNTGIPACEGVDSTPLLLCIPDPPSVPADPPIISNEAFFARLITRAPPSL